jgi:Set1/Ash2 histone methyltransferase complex subunit ASH2
MVDKDDDFLIQVPTNKETSSTFEDSGTRDIVVRKQKKRTNVWTKTSTRKGNKKIKPSKIPNGDKIEETLEMNFTEPYLLEEKNVIQLSKVCISINHTFWFDSIFILYFI